MAGNYCNHCSANIPPAARFCPRCGQDVGATKPDASAGASTPGPSRPPGALPSRSRMPVAGILFLVAAVLGPTMIAVGVSTGNPVLLVGGIVIALGLIALLLLGMVF